MPEGSTVRNVGVIVEWSNDKGFGFIRQRGAKVSDPLVYIGSSSMATRGRTPSQGDSVTYELVELPMTGKNARLRTRLRAENAVMVGDELRRSAGTASYTFVIVGVGYLVLLTTVGFFHPLGFWPCLVSYSTTLLALLLYLVDKEAARSGEWRIAESTLHFLALLGGWPGAALAQTWLRHKTRKESFQHVFLVTVLINVGATIGVLVATWLR